MATRSFVARKNLQGKIEAIYVHWDGYLDGVGKTLTENYTDSTKIARLVRLGDASVLDAELGTGAHDFSKRPEGVSNFYGRDRGETGVDAKTFDTVAEYIEFAKNSGADFVYYWTGKEWLYEDTYEIDMTDIKLMDAELALLEHA